MSPGPGALPHTARKNGRFRHFVNYRMGESCVRVNSGYSIDVNELRRNGEPVVHRRARTPKDAENTLKTASDMPAASPRKSSGDSHGCGGGERGRD